MQAPTILPLALALGLGLLVGLQRRRSGPHVAGIRTIAIVTLTGALLGLLAPVGGDWLGVVGLAGVVAIVVSAHAASAKHDAHAGMTTAAAVVTMYGVGLALGHGLTELGVIVGGVVAALLQWKRPIHEGVDRLAKSDLQAVMRLALIGLIILPLLPDESYGPYGVVNPFEIWLIVVLVCGISLGGYLAARFIGGGTGVLVSGLLGGLISSTATTVSHARLSRRAPAAAASSATIIAIASTTVFGRILVEVAVVEPGLVLPMAPQLGVVAGLMAVATALLFWRTTRESVDVDVVGDPLELRAALTFGLLYVIVLLGVAAAREHLGDEGLYLVAAISGLTDVDAITLSTSRMIGENRIALDVGWRMIVIGVVANLAFKAVIVGLLGDRKTLALVTMAFGVAAAGGVPLVLLWPTPGG